MFNPDQALLLSQVFLRTLEDEAQTTKKVLAAVPENQLDFKLGEKGRTARELMWHIIESEAWFGDGIAAGQFGGFEAQQQPPATAAEMVAWYEKEIPAKIAKIKALRGEDLVKTVNFFNVFNLPSVLYLSFWSNHSIHHRGQLSTYVRAMNGHVPSIYGGSADEPFEMPATA